MLYLSMKKISDQWVVLPLVLGIRLRDNDYVIGSAILKPESKVFVISENGCGKQTAASEYQLKAVVEKV